MLHRKYSHLGGCEHLENSMHNLLSEVFSGLAWHDCHWNKHVFIGQEVGLISWKVVSVVLTTHSHPLLLANHGWKMNTHKSLSRTLLLIMESQWTSGFWDPKETTKNIFFNSQLAWLCHSKNLKKWFCWRGGLATCKGQQRVMSGLTGLCVWGVVCVWMWVGVKDPKLPRLFSNPWA